MLGPTGRLLLNRLLSQPILGGHFSCSIKLAICENTLCLSSGESEVNSEMQLASTIEFPTKSDIVYVVGFRSNDEFGPIYVGESTRNVGRFGDYVSAKFSAQTDFKVGVAARHLQSLGFDVLIKYGETPNRKAEEGALTRLYRAKGYQLLNGRFGYRYETADRKEMKLRITNFIDEVLTALTKGLVNSASARCANPMKSGSTYPEVSQRDTLGPAGQTNHECFKNAFRAYAGREFTTHQITELILEAYPEFAQGSILPNDHAKGNKGACWCAGTVDRIFDQVERGLYRVR